MEKDLTIGLIVKPQGIRGEVKVKPYTDGAESFRGLKRVFLDGEERKVLSVRCGADAVYLGLKGVPDRNAAELLRGKELTIPREEAPDHGEVCSDGGTLFGVLTDIRHAATDIYTLDMEGKEVLFPAVKGVITDIDLSAKRITVDEKRFREVAVL